MQQFGIKKCHAFDENLSRLCMKSSTSFFLAPVNKKNKMRQSSISKHTKLRVSMCYDISGTTIGTKCSMATTAAIQCFQ
jgi:hypothetical protein